MTAEQAQIDKLTKELETVKASKSNLIEDFDKMKEAYKGLGGQLEYDDEEEESQQEENKKDWEEI